MNRNNSKKRARVLIVDDHPAVREALAMRIGRQPDLEVCGEAADMSEALRLVADTQPDVAVIDISLKTGNGIDLIKRIKDRNDTRPHAGLVDAQRVALRRACPPGRGAGLHQQGPGHGQDRRGHPAGAGRQGLPERRDGRDDVAPRRRRGATRKSRARRSTRWPIASWRSSV